MLFKTLVLNPDPQPCRHLAPQIRRKSKCLTQRELNHAYDGPEFTLADKYGEHLGVVFVCLLFSGGMPLMYIIAFLSFVAAYWLEKYYLLKVRVCGVGGRSVGQTVEGQGQE